MRGPKLMRPKLAIAVAVVAAVPVFAGGAADASASHALIEGSGSGWSANAVNQWIADVQPTGLQVVYTSNGSAQGRKDFANRTTDYAVSDIGYQYNADGANDTPQGRAFAYLPVVAGGTAFPYQVRVGGQLVRNLRLSGLTLAKIFTLQIKNWDDPAITKDNNGHALPNLPIIPVVHSEGSGSTAQFTRYLDKQYPSIWRPYFQGSGLTEYYPAHSGMIAQNGSDGVMNFVSSSAADGAIGYDEFSYALSKGYPVAKIENVAGFFTAPTQYNVAVALTKAQINMDKSSQDYLLQNLDQVYTYGDVRTYPLSSYSYMLIPTASNDPRMTTAKRQTLADFINYSVCEGQAEMGPIGYSPLPINLAQASFDQVAKLHTADPSVDVSHAAVTKCHNPTFVAGQPTRNYLAEIAPRPPLCDKAGQGPCNGSVGTAIGNPVGGKPSGISTGGTTGSTTGATTGRSTGATTGATTGVASAATGAGTVGGTGTSGYAAAPVGEVQAVPTDVAAHSSTSIGLGVLAVLLLLAIVTAPPLLAHRLKRT